MTLWSPRLVPVCLLRRFDHRHRRLRAEVDDPVRGLDNVQVVFDDDNGVAAIAQAMQYVQQMFDVEKVQPGGRLIENV